MSYRGIKQVLGETSLERKCRWWFGITLSVLLFLTFFFSGQRLRQIVYDSNRKLGPELVRAAWLEQHLKFFLEVTGEDPEGGSTVPDQQAWKKFSEKMLGSSRELGRDFTWYSIFPQSPDLYGPNVIPKNPPTNGFERELLNRFLNTNQNDETQPDQDLPFPEQYLEVEDREVYRYYQPVYAEKSCIQCHQDMGPAPRSVLAEGDLFALVRVEIEQEEINEDIVKYEAIMWAIALIIGILSMFLLYFIVRYVIVKPVQHLREVSDAVREGDIDQRAEINTGDEFEELAAAFNRMLRRLLRQQDALQDVNDELDAKIDQLAQANLRLFEMNRLKSDFLATMSHELRTPLNSILGFSDVLGSIDSLNNKQQRYVGNIQRSGKILLEMINDILDLAKMESGRMGVHPTEFSIESVISAHCDMARPLSERKNIDLTAVCPSDLPPVRQDQAKLQQVLNNLLSNAIKFTPEGGRIEVRASRDEGEHSSVLPGVRDDSWLYLEVEDTGIGISDADKQVIFEKFRQGASATPTGDVMTRDQGGTGLGLSIVRELCRLLGGDVSLRSVSGKGSTFIVRLPWHLPERTDLDAELERGVAELTRPSMPSLASPSETS